MIGYCMVGDLAAVVCGDSSLRLNWSLHRGT
jgi:hypothetical protein